MFIALSMFSGFSLFLKSIVALTVDIPLPLQKDPWHSFSVAVPADNSEYSSISFSQPPVSTCKPTNSEIMTMSSTTGQLKAQAPLQSLQNLSPL